MTPDSEAAVPGLSGADIERVFRAEYGRAVAALVRAFGGFLREHRRFDATVNREMAARQRSLFYLEKLRIFHAIVTILLTLGLVALFTEIMKRATSAAWLILLLIIIVAASSVSFSSKNIQLAQFAVMITLLLPRERP